MAGEVYTGDVAYQDGWHIAVDESDVPGDRLFLDDDGSYRLAAEGDESWHERKHQSFATLQMEDGGTIRITASEADAVKNLLSGLRGE